jgi:integrase
MWFSRNVPTDEAEEVTVEVLLDQFMAEYVAVYLKESTFESYSHYIKPLKKVFGHLHPALIQAKDVFQYQTFRPKSSGNREASVLSSALQFAIEKGWVDSNPLQGVITKRGKRREQSRRRVPSQEDISALIEIQPELAGHIALKRITGMRKGQLLNINLTDDWNGTELFVQGTKGGNDTIYKGDALVEVISLILGDRLPTAMRKFVAQGGERFNEHDIRKLVANGADNLIHAQALLGHTSPKITASVYRIKPVETDVL